MTRYVHRGNHNSSSARQSTKPNALVSSHRKLLEETGVAVLPGDAFGRDPEELTVRISMVDFDGRMALDCADDTDAVLRVVQPVLVAMDLIIKWLNKAH
jgi:aspartate aminotransferase